MNDARKMIRHFCFDSWLADGYHIDPKNDNCAVDNEFRKARNHIKRNATDSYDEWDKSYFSLNKTNNQTNKTNVF